MIAQIERQQQEIAGLSAPKTCDSCKWNSGVIATTFRNAADQRIRCIEPNMKTAATGLYGYAAVPAEVNGQPFGCSAHVLKPTEAE